MANLPGSIKNLNTLLGEQLTEGGGGGSSDFSTAEVTFISSSGAYTVFVANVEENETIRIDELGASDESIETSVIKLPLYKGSCVIKVGCFKGLDQSVTPTTTGSIELSRTANGFVITGDGSITCAGTVDFY